MDEARDEYAVGGQDGAYDCEEFGVEARPGSQVYAVSGESTDAWESLPDFPSGRIVRRTVTVAEWEYVDTSAWGEA